MNKLHISVSVILLLASCSSNNGEATTDKNESYESRHLPANPGNVSETADFGSGDYNSTQSGQSYEDGYKFGNDMGYIAAQNNDEYNPYLPVGPNVSSFTQEYRRGYSMGYSAGYERGQKMSQTGIYAEDREVNYEVDYEDYSEYYEEY